MESSTEKTISKQLVAEDLKINPDIEGAANCEKKEIPSEIDQEKAQRDELKPVIEATTTYNTGLQSGAENSTNLSAIMRETPEIPADFVLRHRMLEETFEKTVRYQEYVLATIRKSRAFRMLEDAKEECRKARQELENTQREIELLEQKVEKENQEMFDSFIEQAVQIGIAQEILEEKLALLAARKRRQEQVSAPPK